MDSLIGVGREKPQHQFFAGETRHLAQVSQIGS